MGEVAGRGGKVARVTGRVPLASRPGAGVIERELLAESGESEEKARREGDPFQSEAGIFDNLGWKHALS